MSCTVPGTPDLKADGGLVPILCSCSSRGTTVNHLRVHTNLRGFREAPGLRSEGKSRTCRAERSRKASKESCVRRPYGERERGPLRVFLLSVVDAEGGTRGCWAGKEVSRVLWAGPSAWAGADLSFSSSALELVTRCLEKALKVGG